MTSLYGANCLCEGRTLDLLLRRDRASAGCDWLCLVLSRCTTVARLETVERRYLKKRQVYTKFSPKQGLYVVGKFGKKSKRLKRVAEPTPVPGPRKITITGR